MCGGKLIRNSNKLLFAWSREDLKPITCVQIQCVAQGRCVMMQENWSHIPDLVERGSTLVWGGRMRPDRVKIFC